MLGTLWLPERDPSGVVLVHPATATPERFYVPFASYLRDQGVAALTYDYRGTGESGRPVDHPGLRMRDWMSCDVPAVTRFARERFPALPFYGIGHSVGGHALVLGFGVDELERCATVSTHLAVTARIAPWRERARVTLALNVLGPLATTLTGYMPGKRLGLGGDIPTAALLEWGRWIRRPGYFFDDASMDAAARAASVDLDVLAVAASDDLWASPQQVRALMDHLTSARVQHVTYSPDALGVPALGHHGLFRSAAGAKAWPELLQWLTTGGLPR